MGVRIQSERVSGNPRNPHEETWSRGWHLRYWLAPLERTCEEIAQSGFFIERILEPRPTLEAADLNPEEWERLQREPGFMTFRLVPKHETDY
jgi:hypothetical protein